MNRIPLAKISLCVLTLVVVGALTARANLVVNGGFETGDFTGWTVNDPSGFSGVGSDPGFAHSGTHYAFLGANPNTGMLTQAQNLMTTTGTVYTLSFFLANDVTVNQNLSPTNFFEVKWNGAPIFSLTNQAAFDYTQITFALLATGPSTGLEFDYQHGNDFWRLDDVSVNAGVPEAASTLWLALPVFAGLGLLHFRFKNSKGAAVR
jgi:hypothetical protein